MNCRGAIYEWAYCRQVRSEFHLVSFTRELILTAFNGVAYTFITVLFVLYLLFEKPDTYTGGGNGHVATLADGSTTMRPRVMTLRRQIDNQIQRYIVIKTAISAALGTAVWVALGPCLKVKLAHLFGVLTFLANFIPNVGAMLSTILPLPVVVLDPDLSGKPVIRPSLDAYAPQEASNPK